MPHQPELPMNIHNTKDEGPFGSAIKWITHTVMRRRRLSVYRVVLIALSTVALIVVMTNMNRDLGAPSDIKRGGSSVKSSDHLDGSKSGSGKNSTRKPLSKSSRLERNKDLIGWENKANFRTDLLAVASSRKSAFSPKLFEGVVTAQTPLVDGGNAAANYHSKSSFLPVTAVVLSWKRKEGIKTVVRYLKRYPFIQEILIWNNDPDEFLKLSDFTRKQPKSANGADGEGNEDADGNKDSWSRESYTQDFIDDSFEESGHEPTITVMNAVANLHDFSKYVTCSYAQYDHCYIQDDDWINLSMDSMYRTFIQQPHVLLTTTMPTMHAQQRSWMFANQDIGLHTGFSWLGSGSFMSKEAAFKFLLQLGGSNLWKERIQLSDMFFSLWKNQYPMVLSQALAPLDQSSSWGGIVDPWSVVYEHLSDAISRLAFTLSSGNEGSVRGSPHRIGAREDFVAEEESPKFEERYSRCSCTNDKCLFQTNMDQFPSPNKVKFVSRGRSINNHPNDIETQEAKFKNLGFPSPEFVAMYAYHYAVDQDHKSCWRSYNNPQRKDFFGIELVVPLGLDAEHLATDSKGQDDLLRLELESTRVASLEAFENKIRVITSEDGETWSLCELEDSDRPNDTTVRMVLSRCRSKGMGSRRARASKDDLEHAPGIRFVRVEFLEPLADQVEVCGMRIEGMQL